MADTYEIRMRCRDAGETRTVATGLSLADAQELCNGANACRGADDIRAGKHFEFEREGAGIRGGSTRHVEVYHGSVVSAGNRTDEVQTGSPHWYISYNNCDIAAYGSDTTALVLGQMEYFLILVGDHRAGFQQAIAGGDNRSQGISRLERCLQYVRDHRSELHRHSSPLA